MNVPLADQSARDRIRGDLDTTLIVEAAAGTGKTSELVRRMVAAVMAGRARLDRMVAVTFTDVAAGELKLRMRAAIEERRQDRDTAAAARICLTEALPQLEEARIGTIHSFCAELLRERPVEAQVDPLFQVAPADVAGPLLDRAFDRWFEQVLAAPGEAVRRLLRRQTGEDGPRVRLRTAARELVERRDFPAPWRRDGGFDRDHTIDAIIDEMRALGQAAASGDPKDYFTRSLAAIARFVADVERRERVRGRDYDGLEAQLTEFVRDRYRARHWTWIGFKRAPDGFPKAELLQRRDALHAHLEAFIAAAGADLAPQLHDELWPVVAAYQHLKERAGCLDFLDLLLKARDLVRDNVTVRTELQQRFTHLFVDEFQDTDPLQIEISSCSQPTIPRSATGTTFARALGNSSWLVTRSSRSTASGGPMSPYTRR